MEGNEQTDVLFEEKFGDLGEGELPDPTIAVAGVEPEPDHAHCAVEREIDAIFEQAFSERDEIDTDDAVAQRAAQRVIDEEMGRCPSRLLLRTRRRE